jgi:adenylate cyclase
MTLPRFFAATVALLGVLAGATLALALHTSTRAIVRVAEDARVARANQVVASIEAELGAAGRAIDDFEQALAAGVVDDRDLHSLRRYFTAELIARSQLTDLSLTSADLLRYSDDGTAVLSSSGHRQVSLLRDSAGHITYRTFDAARHDADPTEHDTFRAAANREARGQALWSDLAFAERDAALPPMARRKTMTVQKAVFVGAGASERFVGVLRAGLVSETLDRLGTAAPAGDPHRIFICDRAGRLVTRLTPGDLYGTIDVDGRPDDDGDLRVLPAALPASIEAALTLARTGALGGNRMLVGGEPELLTLVPIAEGRAQDWLVGVVVPERYYTAPLVAGRNRLVILLTAALIFIAILGAAGTGTVGRGMRSLRASTEAMRHFSFAPTGAVRSPFREVRSALESLERAKTALRAMVKYVPVDLVRRLYDSGRDPTIGAVPSDVTIMFTDIADFTTHAEALAPDTLAQALGRYFEAATRAVEATGGVVDKYIGDALMVLWNVPSAVSAHPAAACRAALACAEATRVLAGATWWREAGLPAWRTRFGIHSDHVLVGNFGAPDRLSYTAMGDGVNLAARLEGLNKMYGTSILVSDPVRRRSGDGFVFRLVDRVAVKGKTRAVSVYELVGEVTDLRLATRRALLRRYEEALALAWDRHFAEALAILDDLPDDGPAEVLAQRCRDWLVTPPEPAWDGTWAATSK